MLTRLTNENKIYRDFGPKPKKEEVFHTSGYGVAQSGDKIGAAGDGLDVAKRKAIEEQRKYVRGYNNAKIMNGLYRTQRIAEMTPRTAGGRGSLVGGEGDGLDSGAGKVGAGLRSGGGTSSGAGEYGGSSGSQGDKGARVVGLRGEGGNLGNSGGGSGSGLSSGGPKPNVSRKPMGPRKR